VKVSEAPARRCGYYLTPQGFAEKSRLTVDYLSFSFSLFRRARSEYVKVLGGVRDGGFTCLVPTGVLDLAEIVAISAIDDGTQNYWLGQFRIHVRAVCWGMLTS
jgi:hypothetical protein